jgi:hypothetical protein
MFNNHSGINNFTDQFVARLFFRSDSANRRQYEGHAKNGVQWVPERQQLYLKRQSR